MDIKIDKDLLRSWCEMEDSSDYLERMVAFANNSTKERFDVLLREYGQLLKERIDYCKGILNTHKDVLIYYTLAELYNRQDPDESPDYLYKRAVRYYCIKAVRLDRNYAPAWALLAYAYSWIALFGGDAGDDNVIADIKVLPIKEETGIESVLPASFSDILSEGQKRKLKCIERAIYCIRKALKIEPLNTAYQFHLKQYCHQRNEEYKPENLPRSLM
ncbi:MAG: hypothetical protein KJ893_10520 [Candidatus Omnitrophica bacterium]|nr:hypothetical protein [Candidatus Omnitrophota bacterium]MBU4477532.1 hypothetical protein [Candidatus Omnitrophota bacterium]